MSSRQSDTLVRCVVCGREQRVDFAARLRSGWPKCHNATMRVEETDCGIQEATDGSRGSPSIGDAPGAPEDGPVRANSPRIGPTGAPPILLHMDVAGAHAVWHAIDTTIRLLDALGDDNIPVNAALYGQRDRLAGIARRRRSRRWPQHGPVAGW